MIDLIKKLEYSKVAVRFLLENENGSVDFHSISYWAGEVERLRKEIKTKL